MHVLRAAVHNTPAQLRRFTGGKAFRNKRHIVQQEIRFAPIALHLQVNRAAAAVIAAAAAVIRKIQRNGIVGLLHNIIHRDRQLQFPVAVYADIADIAATRQT